MDERTCSADGCLRAIHAKGLCKRHYERQRIAAAPPQAPCMIDGCEMPQQNRGWCSTHYHRWRRHGDPTTPVRKRYPTDTVCAIEGCGQKRRKLDWCASHYAQTQRSGEPPQAFNYKWADPGRPCAVCLSPIPANSRSRRYCGPNCQQVAITAKRRGLPVLQAKACARCGCVIDLLAPGIRHGSHVKPSTRKRRADTRLCVDCARQRSYRHRWSAQALASRDGLSCGICGDDVDMALRWPDVLSPSVDHVVARADGGSDDPSNLQLAHLYCNFVKNKRSRWTVT